MHFSWVKGHGGLEGNELVDRLAKGAAVEGGLDVYCKMAREVIVT
jgi:ribonuclease HI